MAEVEEKLGSEIDAITETIDSFLDKKLGTSMDLARETRELLKHLTHALETLESHIQEGIEEEVDSIVGAQGMTVLDLKCLIEDLADRVPDSRLRPSLRVLVKELTRPNCQKLRIDLAISKPERLAHWTTSRSGSNSFARLPQGGPF